MLTEQDIQAYGTTPPGDGRTLVFAPHPDDETLGCGGLLSLVTDAGGEARVVVATDGAMGESNAGFSDYTTTRRKETEAACASLGVGNVAFWSYPDRALACDEALVGSLVEEMESFRPVRIVTTSPLELHPDHRTLYHAVWKALEQSGYACELWLCELTVPLRPNVLVDISSVADRKAAAMEKHASQTAVRRYADMRDGLDRFRAICAEPEASHVEAFHRVRAPEELGGSPGMLGLRISMIEAADDCRRGADVSVIVRTCDRPALLREALQSLAVQTLRPKEVVVVNVGGDVSEILAEFEGTLSVVVPERPENTNRPGACNAGWKAASGKYVLFFDDDDILYPEHLERLVDAAETPGGGIVYSGYDIEQRTVGADGSSVVTRRERRIVAFDASRLFFENYIAFMTALVPRKELEAVGGLDEDFDIYEDWDLWLRLSRRTRFDLLPEATCCYRQCIDVGSGATGAAPNPKWLARIFDKHKDEMRGEDFSGWWQRVVLHEVNRLIRRTESAEAAARRVAELEAELEHHRAVARTKTARLAERVRRILNTLRGRG